MASISEKVVPLYALGFKNVEEKLKNVIHPFIFEFKAQTRLLLSYKYFFVFQNVGYKMNV